MSRLRVILNLSWDLNRKESHGIGVLDSSKVGFPVVEKGNKGTVSSGVTDCPLKTEQEVFVFKVMNKLKR